MILERQRQTFAPACQIENLPPEILRRLDIVKQAGALIARHGHDDGLSTLLAGLTLWLGQEFPIKFLLTAIPDSGLRTSGQALAETMANLGFFAVNGKFRPRQWIKQPRPYLLQLRSGLTAVLKIDAERALLLNRAENTPKIVLLPELMQLEGCTGWAFDFESSDDVLSSASRVHTGYTWMRSLVARFNRGIWSLIIPSIGLTLTALLLPRMVSSFFGEVIRLGTLKPAPYMISGMLLLIVCEQMFLHQRNNFLIWFANRLEYLINVLTLQRLLNISPFFSERMSATSQAARLRSFESIRDFLVGPAFSSIMDMPVAIAGLITLSLIVPLVTPVFCLALLAFGLTFFFSWRASSVQTSIVADQATELQRFSIETLEKRDFIRQTGMQSTWIRRLSEITAREKQAQKKIRLIAMTAEAASSVIYASALISIMALGTHSIWNGEIGRAGLLAITLLGFRALLPFHTLCLSVQRLEQIRRSSKQINLLMDAAEETSPSREKHRIAPLKGQISLVNIGFRGADTRPVFVGLDLEIEPGQVIAIYGAHGTGKTTIFKMMLAMIDMTIGTIRFDGVDLRQLPVAELRRRISYIPQNPRIFPGTLRDNLQSANPLADDATLTSVIAMVGLSAEVAGLAHGLNCQVPSGGDGMFSDSFKYRFAIARALLINSKVLLIDEVPNALLDGEVGALLQKIIREMKGQKTILLVSHRSDFILLADQAIALRYGKVPQIMAPRALLEYAS